MSDQGFPPTPPSGGTPPLPKDASSSQKLSVEITKITKELRDQPPPEGKIRGEVVKRDPGEYKVTVRTSKGDVEIRLPPERPLPAKGSEVEIRLPPRQSAENVKQNPPTLRVTVPAQPPPSPSTPTPPPTSVSTRPPSYTPPPQAGTKQPPAPLPVLQSGQTVQMTLLPPTQLAKIYIPPPSQIIPAQIAPQTAQQQLPALPPQTALIPAPQPLASTPLPTTPTLPPILSEVSIQNPAGTSLLPVEIGKTLPPLPSQNLITQILKLPSPLLTPLQPPVSSPQIQPIFQSMPPVPQPHVLSADTIFQSTKPPELQNTLNAFMTKPATPANQTPPLQGASLQASASITTALPPISPLPTGTPIQTQIANTLPPQIILAEPGLTLQPAHLTPPPTPTLQNTLFQSAQLPAIVVGLTAQEQPVLAIQSPLLPTPLHFILQNIQAEVGTTFSVPTALLKNAFQTMGLPLPANIPDVFLQSQWPALQELTQLLMNTLPQVSQNFMQMMPSPQNPAQLGSAFMFFIAALRTGDVSSWLGERPLDILKRLGKGELLTRLGRDFGSLSRAMGEPLPHDWRGLSFPFANQNELQNIVVYYKKEEREDAKQNKSTQTRFIFDLDLNRLGPVQLDGLYKPGRLDMVVRTDPTLSEDMKQMMRHNFATALRASELSGELSFQHDTENFIKIIDSREKVGLFT